MRSFNEGWAIKGSIDAVFQQDFEGEIELIIIDSGSSDGSIQTIQDDGRARLIEIPLGTYVPGPVLNLGAREASHDWIVYLNADAEPQDAQWLKKLLDSCLNDPMHGVSFSRQVPRSDCKAVYAHDYDRCFGPERESVHWDHFFSMVSCATHRSVLEAVPIREDLQYAEDDEWTRRLIREGYQVHYAIESIAIHSHNYTLRESYKRSFGDAKAMAATSKVHPKNVNLHYYVLLGWVKDAVRDFQWCLKHGRITGIIYAVMVRLAQRLGRRAGHHAGWKHYQREI